MSQIKVNSEIGRLKVVLLHEPGEEIHNLTPSKLDDLLFDDIPWLPLAKKEHQAFAKTFTDAGVKVVYLVDLMKEVLDLSNEIRNAFIDQYIAEANIHSNTLREVTAEYLSGIKDNRELVLKTIAGIKKKDLPSYRVSTLTDHVEDYLFVTDPIPNLYFQRDPFASIGGGVSLNKMYSVTRSRETIYGEYIFKYHPEYKSTPLYYSRYEDVNIEGGDIMVLNNHTLIVGISQRTTSSAVERLAKNLFFNNKTEFDTVLAFTIPQARTFMHLDTVFSQVDKNKFAIHKGCYEKLKIYRLTKDDNNEGKLKVTPLDNSLEEVLKSYIGMDIVLIPCGGDDAISADREQWSDGSNTIAIAPGEVIAYERNDITNAALEKNDIKVHIIPSSELSRGRGGPRCMCMPLVREEVKQFMDLYRRNLLTLLDFTPEEIQYLLDLAISLKKKKHNGEDHALLKGKNIVLLFEKDSTRTRCAFEVAAADLGINAVYIGSSGSQMGKKESIKDTARVLGRMFDGIEYRGFKQSTVVDLATYSNVPTWNGLTEDYHPTQILADFMTIIEQKSKLRGIKMAYLGDGRYNMGNSYLVGAAKMGLDYRMVGPKELWPKEELRNKCLEIAKATGAKLTFTEDVEVGVKDCDVIATDVWVSMGEDFSVWEERINLLKSYQVNARVMSFAKKDAIFIHCLPSFHNLETKVGMEVYEKFGLNGLEVTEEVFEGPQSVVFDEAENRLHTITAVMLATLKENLKL